MRARICGLDQHQVRYTCDGETASGIFEVYDTLCRDVAQRGEQGISLLSETIS